MITQNQTQKEWQIVFIISAIVYLFGCVFYSLFSDTDVEWWAVMDKKEKDEKDPSKVYAVKKEKNDEIVAF